ncbi:hypothetical protein FKK32_30050, partial [Klebsiella pneumoniae]|nr:hypothetical protein [Klebsiella pneumoniae]
MPTTLLAFVVTLGVLIIFHEWGHYRMARACGVKVLRFSLGFGPVLGRWKRGPDGTEFVLSLLPLLMIVSISLRPGNFAGGSLIPSEISFEHWRLALGLPVTDAQGNVTQPPFPVLQWIFNSMKVALVSAAVCLVLSVTSAYAFARMRFAGRDGTLTAMLLLQM